MSSSPPRPSSPQGEGGQDSTPENCFGPDSIRAMCDTIGTFLSEEASRELVRRFISLNVTLFEKFLSKNSILTKPQQVHEFFTQIFFDNFSRKIKVVNRKLKLNFWTKNEDFEQCVL